MKLSLVVTQGKPEGKEIPIRLPQFLVGRDPDCQLRPASPLISKRHCAFLIREEKAYLRDFGSTNGTFLNGQPVTGEVQLQDGQTVKIGPLVFRVRIEATAEQKALKEIPPAPPKKMAKDEEAIAEFLFGDDPPGNTIGIPGGTTVMMAHAGDDTQEEKPPEEAADTPEPMLTDKQRQEAGKVKQKPQNTAATQDAAKLILEKYMRRPRV